MSPNTGTYAPSSAPVMTSLGSNFSLEKQSVGPMGYTGNTYSLANDSAANGTSVVVSGPHPTPAFEGKENYFMPISPLESGFVPDISLGRDRGGVDGTVSKPSHHGRSDEPFYAGKGSGTGDGTEELSAVHDRLMALGMSQIYDPNEPSTALASSSGPAGGSATTKSIGPTAGPGQGTGSTAGNAGGARSSIGVNGSASVSVSGITTDDTASKLYVDMSDPVLFAHRPAPKHAVVQCYIVREKGGLTNLFTSTFNCYFQAEHVFLIGARKSSNTSAYYSISVDPKNYDKHNNPSYLGKLRSNFVGTEFYLYNQGYNPESKDDKDRDSPSARSTPIPFSNATSSLASSSSSHNATTNPITSTGDTNNTTNNTSRTSTQAGLTAKPGVTVPMNDSARAGSSSGGVNIKAGNNNNYGVGMGRTASEEADQPRREIASVTYESNVLTSKGPRRMIALVPRLKKDNTPTIWRPLKPTDTLIANYKATCTSGMYVLSNKQPRWNESVRAYVLNFNGRVTVPSVKNFQLVSSEDSETVILQFGKTGKDHFTMDFTYPLSLYQAFGICMTSLDSKLACE